MFEPGSVRCLLGEVGLVPDKIRVALMRCEPVSWPMKMAESASTCSGVKAKAR